MVDFIVALLVSLLLVYMIYKLYTAEDEVTTKKAQ